ncbi:DegT/DnrJ/EryC1/StrS family aminotransferase [Flavobacterium foetidum]|uniref:DegT/DnrJ/EryC1/StrS family aminotransferase n=1 Tax=Flavobacterium foetidum TaxID=2026681 RepID=UPI00107550C9|nr:DegT/DnrJ/EryC1/StrS family aminotransferase [Flavobacterium foetidum]KAF2516511.1 DegT/DnrJ/EryC1/StrS family aminotransferase [Flavobacterium foetidum]
MISFLDLKKINEPYESAFQEKLKTVLHNGWYILGEELHTFEKSFAAFCNKKHCIGTGNGFDALVLIFKAYIELGKLKNGDEVIVPANTFIASILAVKQAGLVPVLVEPKIETYTINPDLIQEKITPNTKAILAVHLYGQLAEMNAIQEIAVKNNLLLIEDAAQSHGVQESHKKYLNSAIAYSFYPGKNLGCLGDGGAVVTDDEELAKMLFSLRNYGSEKKYHTDFIGVNSRLDELQASFLNLKLPHLNRDNEKRRAVAKRYLKEIKNDRIILPFWDFSNNHVFHLFVIRTEKRDELQQYLALNNIQTVIHYPIPPHRQKAFSDWNELSFPITEKIHDEVLSLPMSPVLTEEEVAFVIEILNRY